MTSPYINTVLETTVSISPSQMNNSVYVNMKDTLRRNLEGKCYKDYGYISKIYDIRKTSDAEIVPENPTAAANIGVLFGCKLCRPIINKTIVCKVFKITGALINVKNGPIDVFIVPDGIRQEVFFKDAKSNSLMYRDLKNPSKISEAVKPGSFVKINILSIMMRNGDNVIKVIGYLEDIATQEEGKQLYVDEYSDIGEFIKANDYIKNGKKNIIEESNIINEVSNDFVDEKEVKEDI